MRRQDSGWRDAALTEWHTAYGYHAPASGMILPMIEYDRGEPLALISYIPRHEPLPSGEDVVASYAAFSMLHRPTGEQLPFFTVMYDNRTWAFRLYGHNTSAREFLGVESQRWVSWTEREFVANLYRLRGRYMPDLAPYGVTFNDATWLTADPIVVLDEAWPGQSMSQRRRNYEPAGQVRMAWRNPTTDIDFAVMDRDQRIALVVDYKAPGARVNLGSTNMKALSSLHTTRRYASAMASVPAMVVRYDIERDHPKFAVHCLNQEASLHLAYALGAADATDELAAAVAGDEWVHLSEAQWLGVLGCARDL